MAPLPITWLRPSTGGFSGRHFPAENLCGLLSACLARGRVRARSVFVNSSITNDKDNDLFVSSEVRERTRRQHIREFNRLAEVGVFFYNILYLWRGREGCSPLPHEISGSHIAR